jgi:hypothetical protein
VRCFTIVPFSVCDFDYLASGYEMFAYISILFRGAFLFAVEINRLLKTKLSIDN